MVPRERVWLLDIIDEKLDSMEIEHDEMVSDPKADPAIIAEMTRMLEMATRLRQKIVTGRYRD
jgi:hypothetical protein